MMKKKKKSEELLSQAITTIISEDCTVKGPIECNAYIKIDGKVFGMVKGTGVVLGQNGFVQGDIVAKELIVFGKVEGNVQTENISLKEKGAITGKISTHYIQIEHGAAYNGVVEMTTPPQTSKKMEIKA